MIETLDHKSQVQAYFNGVGFERWKAIYGDEEVSRIRRTVREGHARMLVLAESWLVDALREPATVLDAGCGTGLFSIALARRGLRITAVDSAPQMVAAAQANANRAACAPAINFVASDLEAVGGSYDAVACLDVLVHYPRPAFGQICQTLAARSCNTLLITYAPRTPLLAALHWLGGRFPQGQRRTDIQMIDDAAVRHILGAAGMQVQRTVTISHGFYHVTLLQAQLIPETRGAYV